MQRFNPRNVCLIPHEYSGPTCARSKNQTEYAVAMNESMSPCAAALTRLLSTTEKNQGALEFPKKRSLSSISDTYPCRDSLLSVLDYKQKPHHQPSGNPAVLLDDAWALLLTRRQKKPSACRPRSSPPNVTAGNPSPTFLNSDH